MGKKASRDYYSGEMLDDLANSKSNLFLLGNGGHAGVILDMLTEIGVNVSAVYSPVAPVNSTLFADIEHRTSDQDILRYDPENTFLINGIGMLPNKDIRRNVFNRFNNHGYRFISVISPTAKISKHAIIGEGVQIFIMLLSRPVVRLVTIQY